MNPIANPDQIMAFFQTIPVEDRKRVAELSLWNVCHLFQDIDTSSVYFGVVTDRTDGVITDHIRVPNSEIVLISLLYASYGAPGIEVWIKTERGEPIFNPTWVDEMAHAFILWFRHNARSRPADPLSQYFYDRIFEGVIEP